MISAKIKVHASRKTRIGNMINNLVILALSLIVVVPILIVVFNSFKTQAEAASFTLSLPSSFSLDNYAEVFRTSNIGRAMLNGTIYCVGASVLVMVVSSLAAFVLNRRQTKASKLIYYVFLLGLVLPMSIIPTIMLTKALGLYGSYINLVLLYTAFNIPFCVFMYYNFMGTIPRSLDEAVVIDGGNAFALYTKFIFPLLKPVSITTLLIVGTGIWNDFYYQLYFTRSSTMWAMPMTVYGYFGQYSRSWNLVCADIMIAMLPVMVLFIAFQKQIVEGMTVGSVKG